MEQNTQIANHIKRLTEIGVKAHRHSYGLSAYFSLGALIAMGVLAASTVFDSPNSQWQMIADQVWLPALIALPVSAVAAILEWDRARRKPVQDALLQDIAALSFQNKQAIDKFTELVAKNGTVGSNDVLELIRSELIHIQRTDRLQRPGATALLSKNQ